MIRPTATVFWLPVIVLHLHWLKPNEKLKCLLKLAVVGCVLMSFARLYYDMLYFVFYACLSVAVQCFGQPQLTDISMQR